MRAAWWAQRLTERQALGRQWTLGRHALQTRLERIKLSQKRLLIEIGEKLGAQIFIIIRLCRRR